VALLVGTAGVCVLIAALGFGLRSSPLVERQAGPASIPTASAPATLEATPPVINSTPRTAPLSPAARPVGIAEDIPIPPSLQPGSFVGRPTGFSFLADTSYSAALAFYEQQLPLAGWRPAAFESKIGRRSAELSYGKDARLLTVRITAAPGLGTVVEIVESELPLE
jgi:hypothetical protein